MSDPQENALPVEMVEAAANCLWSGAPAPGEVLEWASAMLTAAGVPALLEEVERLRRALALYAEYVQFVNDANQGPLFIAHNHGWRCPESDIKRGEEFRARIAAALSQEEPKP